MYIDLAQYDVITTEEIVKHAAFAVAKYKLQGLSVFPLFLNYAKEFILDGIDLSCPIDYPNGCNNTKVRNYEVLNAIRQGANTIDLVVNHSYLLSEKYQSFSKDILSNYNICQDNNTTLRIMFEYRLLNEAIWEKCIKILKELGIDYIFSSTGFRPDDISDNLIVGVCTQNKFPIKVIINGSFWKINQFDTVQQNNIFGIRFNSLNILETIMSQQKCII